MGRWEGMRWVGWWRCGWAAGGPIELFGVPMNPRSASYVVIGPDKPRGEPKRCLTNAGVNNRPISPK